MDPQKAESALETPISVYGRILHVPCDVSLLLMMMSLGLTAIGCSPRRFMYTLVCVARIPNNHHYRWSVNHNNTVVVSPLCQCCLLLHWWTFS